MGGLGDLRVAALPRHDMTTKKLKKCEVAHTDAVSARFPHVPPDLPLFAFIIAYIQRRTPIQYFIVDEIRFGALDG